MKPPFLLFDFDGTIADSIHLLLKIAHIVAPRFGLKQMNDEDFTKIRSMTIPQAIRYLRIPIYKIPRLISMALVEYRHLVHELEPYEGIREMLEELRSMGCEMALLSSNSSENLRHFLEQHKLNYFNWVEGTSGILNKHNSIKKQIRKHALSKNKLIYVGDEIRDIVAARKSGLRIISVSWGFHTTDLLAGRDPDYLVDNPTQIVGLMKSWGSS
ncbi:MAG: HAD-IA family hydrolase [Candidatus Cloacimonetes bacterium]|jgi:phosphoglycolate phosphatase|nr:HAD-IA family hydrolase [Candidatus Cloacimonadota bacterium]MDD2507253.1 HAD-IA family hydrolase [Candidatus Cloacimonadota bacterium]MDD4147491.1 HAD-IA family hydrolase [Candidatus Cloacimonadota bacterium]MDD4559982.1 HAD-IA family hydrolase [Candidatus Cloacimonadota bacterium]